MEKVWGNFYNYGKGSEMKDLEWVGTVICEELNIKKGIYKLDDGEYFLVELDPIEAYHGSEVKVVEELDEEELKNVYQWIEGALADIAAEKAHTEKSWGTLDDTPPPPGETLNS